MQVPDFDALVEGVDREAKAAQGRDGKGQVPDSVWQTYSSFCNTSGGVILLGVEERGDHSLEILGLADVERVRRNFISSVNNRAKISRNLLHDPDIKVIVVDEKQILVITVPRASRTERPVYIGSDPFAGSFRRINDADVRCDERSVKAMLADAVNPDRTASIVMDYTLNDLDEATIGEYRKRFIQVAGNEHRLLRLPVHDFLREIGAAVFDRTAGVVRPTLAGLMMFGRHASIVERLPYFHLDYRVIDQRDPKRNRYIERIVWDGNWSGNLMEFYERVSPRMYGAAPAPFTLDTSMQRVDVSEVRIALREAFLNACIHADYDIEGGIVIILNGDLWTFRNPGLMRVPLEQAIEGGISDCRNALLQQMFRLIGLVEQIGSGVPFIIETWNEQSWVCPTLEDAFQPDRTELRLQMSDRRFLLRHGKTTGASYMLDPALVSLKKSKSESSIALVHDSGYADVEHLMSALLEACSMPKSLDELALLLNRSKQRLRAVVRMLLKAEKLRTAYSQPSHPRQKYVRT